MRQTFKLYTVSKNFQRRNLRKMLVIWSLVLLLSVSFSEQGLIDSIKLYKKGFLGSKKGIDGDVAEDARLTTVSTLNNIKLF